MEDKLDRIANELQHNASVKCSREIEKSQAYQQGYVDGIEAFYKYIRQERILDANKQK